MKSCEMIMKIRRWSDHANSRIKLEGFSIGGNITNHGICVQGHITLQRRLLSVKQRHKFKTTNRL